MSTDIRERPAAAGGPVIAPAAKEPAARQPEAKAYLNKGLDSFIEQFKVQQSEYARNAGATNHDIYEPRLAAGMPNFTDVPYSMFFYYVRVDADGRLRVDHYFYVDGDKSDSTTWQQIPYYKPGLRDLVQRLAVNARPLPRDGSRVRDPAPDANVNFQNIEWNRKSYIAIFLDEAHWQFHKFPAEDSAVVFITEPKNGKTGTVNHSFFDAMDIEVTMPISRPRPGGPTSDERSAIVFVNHMKADDAGTDLAVDAREFFQFKMFLDVAFASGNAVPMTVIFDPDGTNMGPPLTPP